MIKTYLKKNNNQSKKIINKNCKKGNKMKINELKAKQGNVNVKGTIIECGAVREFNKFGKAGKVMNATLKDDSGTITLTLWNEDVEKINTGYEVEIINGWVSEWNNELQLSTGKFGKINIIAKGANNSENNKKSKLTDFSNDENENILTADEKTEEESLYELTTDKGEHILTKDEIEESNNFSNNENKQAISKVPEKPKVDEEEIPD